MRVHLATDHAGFEAKNHLAETLRASGHEVVDHGPFVYDAADHYPVFCLRAAEAVAADPESLGVVLGGSGNGEQIAANKVRGVRAALCNDVYTAKMSRAHNDANVLALGARVVGTGLAEEIVRTWLHTPFDGGRHARRVKLISDIEEEERGR
jgi:ribose 5-phosphate isomerase B